MPIALASRIPFPSQHTITIAIPSFSPAGQVGLKEREEVGDRDIFLV
jgi:hypothetical protein